MKRERRILLNVVILVIAFGMAGVAYAEAMGTAFTYQGRLSDANSPADDLYDFEFEVYDALDGGSQQGSTVSKDDIDIIDSYFTVELDFGGAVFTGDARWLQVAVRPGASSDPCDFVTLSPRQEVTPTPYAIYAENAGSDNDWAVSGDDMYSIPSGNVGIGTTTPAHKLEVKAPTNQALRLSTESTNSNVDIQAAPTGSGSMRLNVFGGANAITFNVNNTEKVRMNSNGDIGIGTASPGARLEVNGQVKITGGSPGADKVLTSDASGLATWQTPSATADSDWQVSGVDMYSLPSGKVGIGTTSPAAKLTVNGAILRDGSTMYGTNANTHINLGTSSTTGTDGQNYSYATVGGGENNSATNDNATVGGGYNNEASSNDATVGGGYSNEASGNYATVGGGYHNTASNYHATVGGGSSNTASNYHATVGGGYNNTASGQYYATVGGGGYNWADNWSATVGGGLNNTASGDHATVGGGKYNTASEYGATVPGGKDNTAGGDYSFAAGRRAKANHDGAFVWADSTDTDFQSTGPDQFLIRASGGVGIGTTSPGAPLHIAGGNWDLTNTEGDFKIGNNTYRLKIGIATGGGGAGSVGIRSHGGTGNLILGSNTTEVLMVQDTGGGRVGIGTMSPNGTLDVNGSIYQRGGVLHADYVFEPDYELETIDEHSDFMWENKHLKAIPQASVDENGLEIVEVGSHRRGIVEELEKAHIYIAQLHERLERLEAVLAEVKEN